MVISNCVQLQYVVWLPLSSSKIKKRKPFALSATAKTEQIRVCTNRTCRKQGSMQTLEIMMALSPPDLPVNSCGCLGRCGAGPNVALLPQGIIVGHCGTAAAAARIMARHNDDEVDDATIRNSLDAFALRKRARVEFDQGNFSQADLLLSQAIHLKPFGGLHIIYKSRSQVRLLMENYSEALQDAQEALNLAPQYTEAYMCEGDAFMAMKQYDGAEKSYSMCLQIDPTIRRSKAFKVRVAQVQEKLIAANMPYNQQ
ncbi:hypothetical protein P3X46_028047 [Hevea brasiliensis]|uniref:Uncharacterized protein n=1 Tax=Hevea brasiliensis TaxID=3981 RepID=A0ABQ9KP36_HEVBR|nr:uncharacterized protein LOC110655305 [Hevea brasiliensis]KAJ9145694.1 hypothetical protein P3X46_028047 [Hevea brasiliensis]